MTKEGKQRISWPMIDDRKWTFELGQAELEPGETETLHCDFVVSHDVDLARVHSHLPNPAKGPIGWQCFSDVRFAQKEGRDE